MSSLFSQQSIQKIETTRKYVLRAGIWTLVAGVVAGAALIMLGTNSTHGAMIAKVMGTMFIVAVMMMVSVNNFKRLTSDSVAVQAFALVGLIANIAWMVLWTLICWNPEWFFEKASGFGSQMSMLAKCATAVTYISILGFLGSNIMSIYEGGKKDLIKPLKITATICMVYEMVYVTIITFTNFRYTDEMSVRLGMLAGFAGFVWFVIVIAALVMSKSEKNKRADAEAKDREEKARKYEEVMIASSGNAAVNQANQVSQSGQLNQTKTDEQLRAEIEEKVRREMIEKEIREKIAREQD